MEFHRYSAIYPCYLKYVKQQRPRPTKILNNGEFYTFLAEKEDMHQRVLSQTVTEATWLALQRPYYNLWPSIGRALLKVNLDIPVRTLATLPASPFAVRMPAGVPFPELTEDGHPLHAMLVYPFYSVDHIPELLSQASRDKRREVVHQNPSIVLCLHHGGIQVSDDDFPELQLPSIHVAVARFREPLAGIERTVAEMLEDGFGEDLSPVVREAFRLCLALALLSRDDELIQPDVLAEDRGKLGQGHDTELHQKAIRRRGGEIGWDVGREIWEKRDVSPHYRNPHLSKFWVGEGRTRCVIKLRSGSIVKRQQARAVPTGLEDSEVGDHAETQI